MFRGHTKVADNSFPNIIPMLTGKRVMDQQPDMMDEFDHVDVATQVFDSWPFIWRNFSNKGFLYLSSPLNQTDKVRPCRLHHNAV